MNLSEKIGCEYGYLVNNGVCNDESNYHECNYDGGECCGSHVNNKFCKDCKCLNGPWGNGDGWGKDTTTFSSETEGTYAFLIVILIDALNSTRISDTVPYN